MAGTTTPLPPPHPSRKQYVSTIGDDIANQSDRLETLAEKLKKHGDEASSNEVLRLAKVTQEGEDKNLAIEIDRLSKEVKAAVARGLAAPPSSADLTGVAADAAPRPIVELVAEMIRALDDAEQAIGEAKRFANVSSSEDQRIPVYQRVVLAKAKCQIACSRFDLLVENIKVQVHFVFGGPLVNGLFRFLVETAIIEDQTTRSRPDLVAGEDIKISPLLSNRLALLARESAELERRHPFLREPIDFDALTRTFEGILRALNDAKDVKECMRVFLFHKKFLAELMGSLSLAAAQQKTLAQYINENSHKHPTWDELAWRDEYNTKYLENFRKEFCTDLCAKYTFSPQFLNFFNAFFYTIGVGDSYYDEEGRSEERAVADGGTRQEKVGREELYLENWRQAKTAFQFLSDHLPVGPKKGQKHEVGAGSAGTVASGEAQQLSEKCATVTTEDGVSVFKAVIDEVSAQPNFLMRDAFVSLYYQELIRQGAQRKMAEQQASLKNFENDEARISAFKNKLLISTSALNREEMKARRREIDEQCKELAKPSSVKSPQYLEFVRAKEEDLSNKVRAARQEIEIAQETIDYIKGAIGRLSRDSSFESAGDYIDELRFSLLLTSLNGGANENPEDFHLKQARFEIMENYFRALFSGDERLIKWSWERVLTNLTRAKQIYDGLLQSVDQMRLGPDDQNDLRVDYRQKIDQLTQLNPKVLKLLTEGKDRTALDNKRPSTWDRLTRSSAYIAFQVNVLLDEAVENALKYGVKFSLFSNIGNLPTLKLRQKRQGLPKVGQPTVITGPVPPPVLQPAPKASSDAGGSAGSASGGAALPQPPPIQPPLLAKEKGPAFTVSPPPPAKPMPLPVAGPQTSGSGPIPVSAPVSEPAAPPPPADGVPAERKDVAAATKKRRKAETTNQSPRDGKSGAKPHVLTHPHGNPLSIFSAHPYSDDKRAATAPHTIEARGSKIDQKRFLELVMQLMQNPDSLLRACDVALEEAGSSSGCPASAPVASSAPEKKENTLRFERKKSAKDAQPFFTWTYKGKETVYRPDKENGRAQIPAALSSLAPVITSFVLTFQCRATGAGVLKGKGPQEAAQENASGNISSLPSAAAKLAGTSTPTDGTKQPSPITYWVKCEMSKSVGATPKPTDKVTIDPSISFDLESLVDVFKLLYRKYKEVDLRKYEESCRSSGPFAKCFSDKVAKGYKLSIHHLAYFAARRAGFSVDEILTPPQFGIQPTNGSGPALNFKNHVENALRMRSGAKQGWHCADHEDPARTSACLSRSTAQAGA